MKDKLIIRLSNNLGNQMFMYATAYAMSKDLNKELYIDDETAYLTKNNFHSYNLNIFDYSAKTATKDLKFTGFSGYIKRKILKQIDIFNTKRKFYVELKDNNKITSFNNNYKNIQFKNKLFVEGHFESEKYFKKYRNEILNEFNFKNHKSFQNHSYLNELKNTNSVCVCLRQHRFSEKKRDINTDDIKSSEIYSKEQSKFILKAMNYISKKTSNPKFFLWTNDYGNVYKYLPKSNFTTISTNQIDLDLYLMTQSKHFIVIPSSFNWWGCWLSQNNDKIVVRPSGKHFSKFKINNLDFWPSNWKVID